MIFMLNIRILQTKVKFTFVSVFKKIILKCHENVILRKLLKRMVFLIDEDFKYFKVN